MFRRKSWKPPILAEIAARLTACFFILTGMVFSEKAARIMTKPVSAHLIEWLKRKIK